VCVCVLSRNNTLIIPGTSSSGLNSPSGSKSSSKTQDSPTYSLLSPPSALVDAIGEQISKDVMSRESDMLTRGLNDLYEQIESDEIMIEKEKSGRVWVYLCRVLKRALSSESEIRVVRV